MLNTFKIRTSNNYNGLQEKHVRVFFKNSFFSWDEANFSDLPAKSITQESFFSLSKAPMQFRL